MPPHITLSDQIKLPPDKRDVFEGILQEMFPHYQRIVIEKDFTAESFSGSWVFLVHLVSTGPGRHLPVVVKIASTSLIEKEARAYETYIRGKWPKSAEVNGTPVLSKDGKFSGLFYFLVGDGVSPVQSLRSYCVSEESTVQQVEKALRLFATAIVEGVLLYNHEIRQKFRLRASYDSILPVNLWVEPTQPSSDVEPMPVTPNSLPKSSLELGTFVCVEGFAVTKVDLKKHTITLNLPRLDHALPDDSYYMRLKFKSRQAMPNYAMGEVISATVGKVIQTRESQWQAEMEKVMGDQKFDLKSATISVPGAADLPNPFVPLSDMLTKFIDIKVTDIHGDLNLGNILVVSDVGDIRLIDFAEARRDHVLHDFLRMETEIVTKLITPALVNASLPVKETIYRFYQQLHCATFHSNPLSTAQAPHPVLEKPFVMIQIVREIVRDHGLFKPKEYAEYYDCLTLYLLGALKFANLNREAKDPKPWPKEVAFWSAVAVRQVMNSSACTESSRVVANVPPISARQITIESRFSSWKQKSGRLLLLIAVVLGLTLLTIYLSSPQIARWYNNQAIQDSVGGDLSSAKEKYEWAIWWDADNAEAYYNLGFLYEKQVQLEKAEAQYQLAIEGGLDAAYNNLARLYIYDKTDQRYEEAANLLVEGLKIVEDDEVRYDMLKNLGWARLMQADYAQAESHLRAGIRLKNKRAPAYCLLAQVREAQNKLDDALSEWEQCLKYADVSRPDEAEWLRIARERLN